MTATPIWLLVTPCTPGSGMFFFRSAPLTSVVGVPAPPGGVVTAAGFDEVGVPARRREERQNRTLRRQFVSALSSPVEARVLRNP